jgi:5-methylcytosine-specific restriction endonuclease McrA
MKKRAYKRASKVVKSRNAGTFSESSFWMFIRNSLRRRSIVWKPISLCRDKAKRAYKGPNTRQKWEYQCNVCKKWFKGTEIDVDHIKPVGSLNNAQDLPNFVESLFCEVDNLQCICKDCHKDKSLIDNKNTRDGK